MTVHIPPTEPTHNPGDALAWAGKNAFHRKARFVPSRRANAQIEVLDCWAYMPAPGDPIRIIIADPEDVIKPTTDLFLISWRSTMGTLAPSLYTVAARHPQHHWLLLM